MAHSSKLLSLIVTGSKVVTLCVSAVFAVARCLSVCHVVDCIQTAEDIVKLLYRPSSPIILVF